MEKRATALRVRQRRDDYGYPLTNPGPPYPLGGREIAAIVLLLAGAMVIGFGWIAGVALLWSSPRWNLRDKLIGTLAPPGGLIGALWLISVLTTSGQLCTQTPTSGGSSGSMVCAGSSGASLSWVGIAFAMGLAIMPFVTMFYLKRRASQVRPEG